MAGPTSWGLSSSPLHGRIAIAAYSQRWFHRKRPRRTGWDLEVGMVQADIAALAFGRQGDFAQLPAVAGPSAPLPPFMPRTAGGGS